MKITEVILETIDMIEVGNFELTKFIAANPTPLYEESNHKQAFGELAVITDAIDSETPSVNNTYFVLSFIADPIQKYFYMQGGHTPLLLRNISRQVHNGLSYTQFTFKDTNTLVKYPDDLHINDRLSKTFLFNNTDSLDQAKSFILLKLDQTWQLYDKTTPKLNENKNNKFIKQHIQWVADEVGIDKLPKIVLLNEPETTSFGQYSPDDKTIRLVTGNRHPVDVLRTLAHELRHYKQDLDDNLPPGAGETGTDQENDANSTAGVVLRNFAKENPEYFGLDSEEEPLDEDTLTEWKHHDKFGNGWSWGIGDHFIKRWDERHGDAPWSYVDRIIKRLPYIKPKLEQMLNFPKFYLRDDQTGVEIGCKISTFGQPETKLVYMNTVVFKPEQRKGAESPIISVN